jgi:hypothetical protein
MPGFGSGSGIGSTYNECGSETLVYRILIEFLKIGVLISGKACPGWWPEEYCAGGWCADTLPNVRHKLQGT